MGLFHFGKKKEEKEQQCACNAMEKQTKEESFCCCGGGDSVEAEPEKCCCKDEGETKEESCCCGGNVAEAEKCCCKEGVDALVSIKVLGSGCKSCHALYENTKEAVKNAGLSVEVEYITDLEKIMEYGVMSMPGLVVNETVVSAGKVLKASDIENLLHKIDCE